MNKKGFAVSGMIYAILVLFLVLVFGILSILGSRKLTFDKLKKEVLTNLNNNYVVPSANAPELYDNMIPVYYDEETSVWRKADSSNINKQWYDYTNKKWANAVILNDVGTCSNPSYTTRESCLQASKCSLPSITNSTTCNRTYYCTINGQIYSGTNFQTVAAKCEEEGMSATKAVWTQTNWTPGKNTQLLNARVGTEVSEDDILLWYVWIPRYKYVVFNGNNESKPEQLIDVIFETSTNTTGTVTCIDNVDGSETCTDSTNGSIVNGTSTYTHPAFKFGDTELTGLWVGKFEVSGSTSEVTIKPNVASLRNQTVSSFFTAIQNIKTTYGINNADSHMMKNMEWGAVAYLKQSKYGLGTADIAVNDNSSYYTGGGTNDAYKTNIAQSTTGNVYGVYDMSGGTWEYVMGNVKDSSNAFYSSGAGFTTAPATKYYDSYKYDTSNTNHARGKLGDATKETLVTFGNASGGWYSDYAVIPSSGYSWFVRGGNYVNGTIAGVFYFNYFDDNDGTARGDCSTRAVLSAQ